MFIQVWFSLVSGWRQSFPPTQSFSINISFTCQLQLMRSVCDSSHFNRQRVSARSEKSKCWLPTVHLWTWTWNFHHEKHFSSLINYNWNGFNSHSTIIMNVNLYMSMVSTPGFSCIALCVFVFIWSVCKAVIGKVSLWVLANFLCAGPRHSWRPFSGEWPCAKTHILCGKSLRCLLMIKDVISPWNASDEYLSSLLEGKRRCLMNDSVFGLPIPLTSSL